MPYAHPAPAASILLKGGMLFVSIQQRFNGVLLATDYDDTLYGTDFSISPENRRAIEYFVAEGGLFTVSTGRSYINFAIQMATQNLPINTPVVLSNGASIYDFQRNEMLRETHLRPEIAADLAEVCQKFPTVAFEAYHGNHVYVHNANDVTQRHLERAKLSGISLPIPEIPLPWSKAILQEDDHRLLEAARVYMAEKWGGKYEVIFSNPVLLEITDKGVNKGTAVLWLADHLKIERSHIYCVGNGHNDLPMLEVSAVPFAPANCELALKRNGVTILPSCDESCIARLIDHLDRRYAKS